jgi:CO dehydrogenase/acetyl-CoA synthase alpha subunit
MLNIRERVIFATPAKNEKAVEEIRMGIAQGVVEQTQQVGGVTQEIQQVGGVSQGIQEIPKKGKVTQEIQQVGGVSQGIQEIPKKGKVTQGIQQASKKKSKSFIQAGMDQGFL